MKSKQKPMPGQKNATNLGAPAKKRTLKNFFEGAASSAGNAASEAAPKGQGQETKEVEKSLRVAQKLLKEANNEQQVFEWDEFCQGYKGIFSLYDLCEQKPMLMKQSVERLLNSGESEQEKLKTLQSTLFLYFFRLMGIQNSNEDSLDLLMGFLNTKNSTVGKKKEMTNAQVDKLCFNIESSAFLMKGKLAQTQMRNFKKICKLLVSNLVDLFPANKSLLPSIIQEIVNFSKNKMLLIRHSFTCIGMHLFHQILIEVNQLQTLSGFFQKAQKIDRDRVSAVQSAIDFFSTQNASVLMKDVISQRATDVQPFVRKAIYSILASEILTSAAEVRLACTNKDFKLVHLIFTMGIKDDDLEVSQEALSAAWKMLEKMKETKDAQFIKNLEKVYYESKDKLLDKIYPTKETLFGPPQITVFTIKLFTLMSQWFPDCLAENSKKQIASCMFFGNAQVRDAASNFLLQICSDFDDVNSLLPVQKVLRQQANAQSDDKEGENQDDLVINFYSEPHKSKKQLKKLIDAFQDSVLSTSQFSNIVKQFNPDYSNHQSDGTLIQQLQNQSIEQEGSAEQEKEADLKAKLLVAVFKSKTSVIFDVKSIVELFQKEGQSQNTKRMLVSVIYLQLALVKQMAFSQPQQTNSLLYKKYWELSQQVLTLSRINEMLQENRDDKQIMEALFKTILILDEQLETDQQESATDIVSLLVSQAVTVTPTNKLNINFLKTCLDSLSIMQRIHPESKQQISKIVQELYQNIHDSNKDFFQMQSNMTDQNKLKIQMNSLLKYNLFLQNLNLNRVVQSGDQVNEDGSRVENFIETSCRWTITYFVQKVCSVLQSMKDTDSMSLSFVQIQTLLQFGFRNLEQLIGRSSIPGFEEDARLQIFTQSMSEQYLEALYGCYESLKITHKESALCIFAFIAETYIMSEEFIKPEIFQRFHQMLSQLIENISRPGFLPDELSQEYFAIMTNILTKSPKLFASDAGSEYLTTFACCHSSNHILFKPSSDTIKTIKRLLLGYKQRDMIDPSKRSIFNCLMLKRMIHISKMDEFKCFRLLGTSIGDAASLEEIKDLNLSQAQVSLGNQCRLVLLNRFIKTVHASIVLYLNPPKSDVSVSSAKKSEEYAYATMMEDFIKMVLNKYQRPQKQQQDQDQAGVEETETNNDEVVNLWLMRAIPMLMHPGFLSVKTKDAILKSLQTLASVVQEPSNPAVDDTSAFLIDTEEKRQKGLRKADASFIKAFCCRAIIERWLPAQEKKKLIKQEQIVSNEDMPLEEKKTRDDIIFADSTGVRNNVGERPESDEEHKEQKQPKITKAEIQANLGKKRKNVGTLNNSLPTKSQNDKSVSEAVQKGKNDKNSRKMRKHK